jgi:hypothetical protein
MQSLELYCIVILTGFLIHCNLDLLWASTPSSFLTGTLIDFLDLNRGSSPHFFRNDSHLCLFLLFLLKQPRILIDTVQLLIDLIQLLVQLGLYTAGLTHFNHTWLLVEVIKTQDVFFVVGLDSLNGGVGGHSRHHLGLGFQRTLGESRLWVLS